MAPSVEVQVASALDQLTETIDNSLRTIETDSSSGITDRDELEALRQRVRELESDSAVLTLELENSRHNLAVLEEELALQKQLAATVEQLNEDHRALAKRAEDLEMVRANQEREKKVLAHSWEWLQTDRRQLVVEKEEWQQQYNQMLAQSNLWATERDQWLKERDELTTSTSSLTASHAELVELQKTFQNEKAQWELERQQVEDEVRSVAHDLEAARASVASQQAEVANEWSRLQTAEESLKAIRVELDQKMESLESVQVMLESQQHTLQMEHQRQHTERESLNLERQQFEAQKTEFESLRGDVSESEPAIESEASTTKSATVTRRIAIIHEDKDALLSSPSSGDSWSHGVDLTEHTHNEFAAFPRPESTVATEQPDSEQDGFAESSSDLNTAFEQDAAAQTSGKIESSTTDGSRQFSKSNDETTAADPAAVALRAELARMFNLRELERAASTHTKTSNDDGTTSKDLAPDHSAVNDSHIEVSTSFADLPDPDFEAAEQGAESHRSFIREEPLKEGDNSYGGVVMTTNTPVTRGDVRAIESLSFNDDDPVDDSVDRYMQGLLARSRGWSESVDARPLAIAPTPIATPESVVKVVAAPETPPLLVATLNPVAAPNIDVRKSLSERETFAVQSPISEAALSDAKPSATTNPVHKQDKEALRAVTENMREVANLQALKNVETAGWSRLRDSIKVKSALAAFSFILCLGLLYLGYQSKPGFIVLGGCASCIGILTWIDLFMAIYHVRHRSKELDEQHRKRQ